MNNLVTVANKLTLKKSNTEKFPFSAVSWMGDIFLPQFPLQCQYHEFGIYLIWKFIFLLNTDISSIQNIGLKVKIVCQGCNSISILRLQKDKVKVAQSCLTLHDPMDYTIHGILQARRLEWVAFPFSRGSSQPRNWTQVSRIASGFFTSSATREALRKINGLLRLLMV